MIYEGRQAIVLQFGKIVSNEVLLPGLHFKIPFIQNVLYFESRIIDLSPQPKEVIAADQKRVIVDAYAKYKIVNPLKFYQTVGTRSKLASRMKPILESNIRENVGKVSLTCLLAECRNKVMELIQNGVEHQAISFGIEMIDVRIKRTDLPDTNSAAIFKRMQTEREKEAREIRAQGVEESQIIKSGADREKITILSEAKKKAEIIKGNADAESTAIYNKAFSKDIDFFSFVRHMQLYRNSFNNNETKFILSGEESFMGFLQYQNGNKHD
ncbi:protease modulator HflC [Candidatus Xenohaliotis californiensis]